MRFVAGKLRKIDTFALNMHFRNPENTLHSAWETKTLNKSCNRI